jgi:hypothetical protein
MTRRSFELVAEGELTPGPQVQALDQSARKCVKADIGGAFARRSVGVRLEHNHPDSERHVDSEFATLIAPLAFKFVQVPVHSAYMMLRRRLP